MAAAAGGGDARAALLQAVSSGSGVEAAIDALVPLDPSKGKASEMVGGALGGQWQLLWSSADSEVGQCRLNTSG